MSQELPPSDGDVNWGPEVEAVAAVTAAVAFICVALRVFVRTKLSNTLGWDDALIVLSAVCTIPGLAFNILSIHYGIGRHQYYLNPSEISNMIKWNTAYQIENVISVTLTKISIFLFILRIKNTGIIAKVTYAGLVVTVLICIYAEVAVGVQCIPLEGVWDPTVSAKCYKTGTLAKLSYVQGAVNGVLDFVMSFSPAFILWNIQIATRKKVAVCGLMSLGLAATAANIVRTVLLKDLDGSDYSFQIIGIAIAAILEQNLGIIAACIPTLQPLFKCLRDKTRSYRSRTRLTTPECSRGAAGTPAPGDRHRSVDPNRISSHKNFNIVIDSQYGHRQSDESDIPLHELPPSDPTTSDGGISMKKTFDIEYGRSSISQETARQNNPQGWVDKV